VTLDIKSAIASRAMESGGRLKVQSALNPALWLCGIVSVPAMGAAALSTNPPWWIGWLVVGPVAIACLGFIFLLLFDRDKLQSEDFQIKKRSLEIFEQKGMDSPVTLSITDVSIPPDGLITRSGTPS
jgi:hypothetical protein